MTKISGELFSAEVYINYEYWRVKDEMWIAHAILKGKNLQICCLIEM